MESVLMSFDYVEQRADFARAPAVIPLRKARAEMQITYARLAAGRHDLEKRMPRARRIVPLVIVDFSATQKTDRVISSCGPKRRLRRLRDTLNYSRIGRFLENNEVRRRGNNRFRKRLFPAATTKADVVAQQFQGHAFSPGGATTKYGSPNKTSR